MRDNKTLTCQNPSCKKTFTAALKTINLQQNPTEPYFSCPHCLTKIETIDERTEDTSLEKKQTTKQVEIKEELTNSDKAADCHYHPGYLSERTGKEQIPDDCLVCSDMLECMRKK